MRTIKVDEARLPPLADAAVEGLLPRTGGSLRSGTLTRVSGCRYSEALCGPFELAFSADVRGEYIADFGEPNGEPTVADAKPH